ncbi:MAG: hypothetical protein BAJALOKI3v1_750005 [Promethearchaeota archaeon]|nr:MAG: hypothetical protein BAJALOKI3v1_750005 [Candidatus Lokiarchaeota archaeon]
MDLPLMKLLDIAQKDYLQKKLLIKSMKTITSSIEKPKEKETEKKSDLNNNPFIFLT